MTATKPNINFNIIPAYQKERTDVQKVLFIGQQTAAATATSGALQVDIGNANEQDTLFGANSMLAAMIRAAKKINKDTQFDAIGLDDAAGTAATGHVIFGTGPAASSGTITVYIGSSINHKYELTVTSTDTVTAIGDALVAAITADTKSPVTASNSSGDVTLTAVHKGEAGSSIGIKVEGSITDVTLSVTAMSGGATNPTLTTLFDVVTNRRYQTVVWPNSYTLSTVTTFLDNRFNSTNRILDGVAIYSETDTFSTLKSSITAEDSNSLVYFANKLVNDTLYKGSSLFELDYVIASQFAALRSLRMTDSAEISQYVISTFGQSDALGGPALASLPYFNTPFEYLPLIPVGKEFSDTELSELSTAGGSVFLNNSTNTEVITNEVLTTYKTDSAGNEDITYKYLNYVDTPSEIRNYIFNNCKARFAQSRLTEGDVVPNRSMANPTIIKSYIMGLYSDLASEDYVLVQDGETAKKYFAQNLSVTVDLSTGSATVSMIVPIVTQLRSMTINMQISFSTNS